MKVSKTVNHNITLGEGPNEVRLTFSTEEGELPRYVRLEVDDGEGEKVKVIISPEELERAAAAFRDFRRNVEKHYGTELCADHGYYEGRPNSYRCPKCEAEKNAQSAEAAQ